MKNPKHVLITGASGGIGAALACAYAAIGVSLTLLGRNEARLAAVAESAVSKGADVSVHVCDVKNAEEMRRIVQAADGRRALDLVIANAGISGGTSGEGETIAQVEEIFAVNVDGVFNTLHPALSVMEQRGKGQIAIISSLAGFRGLPGAPAYCASKAAVRVYGEGLRADAATNGVEVNVVCPGFIKTPMTDVNNFRMPFLMSPDDAAKTIKTGLMKNKARIAFPWAMYLIVRMIAALPLWIVDAFSSRIPRKSKINTNKTLL